jgi:hypothetical protein
MSTGMPWMPIWNVMRPFSQHGGEGTVALRLAEDAVHAREVRALDRDVLQADVEAVRLRRADRGPRRQLRVDRHLSESLLLRVPERVEVGGLGYGRLDLVGRVSGGREPAVVLALDLRGRDEPEEARFREPLRLHDQAVRRHRDRLLLGRLHLLEPERVGHRRSGDRMAVARHRDAE